MINERQISSSLDDSALPGVPNHLLVSFTQWYKNDDSVFYYLTASLVILQLIY